MEAMTTSTLDSIAVLLVWAGVYKGAWLASLEDKERDRAKRAQQAAADNDRERPDL